MTASTIAQHNIDLRDEAGTVRLAQALAGVYQQQDASSRVQFVTLSGALGTGKTTLVRAFLRALGWAGPVKSPTYNLVETYSLASFSIVHFDLYRLADADELEHLGARDYFSTESLCWVEWPERGQGFLPPADLDIALFSGDESGRHLTFGVYTLAAEQWMAALHQEFSQ